MDHIKTYCLLHPNIRHHSSIHKVHPNSIQLKNKSSLKFNKSEYYFTGVLPISKEEKSNVLSEIMSHVKLKSTVIYIMSTTDSAEINNSIVDMIKNLVQICYIETKTEKVAFTLFKCEGKQLKAVESNAIVSTLSELPTSLISPYYSKLNSHFIQPIAKYLDNSYDRSSLILSCTDASHIVNSPCNTLHCVFLRDHYKYIKAVLNKTGLRTDDHPIYSYLSYQYNTGSISSFILTLPDPRYRNITPLLSFANQFYKHRESNSTSFSSVSSSTLKEVVSPLTNSPDTLNINSSVKGQHMRLPDSYLDKDNDMLDLKQKIERLASQCESATKQIDILNAELASKDLQIEKLVGVNSEKEEKLESLSHVIQTLTDENKRMETSILYIGDERDKLLAKDKDIQPYLLNLKQEITSLRKLIQLTESKEKQKLRANILNKATIKNKILESSTDQSNTFSKQKNRFKSPVSVKKVYEDCPIQSECLNLNSSYTIQSFLTNYIKSVQHYWKLAINNSDMMTDKIEIFEQTIHVMDTLVDSICQKVKPVNDVHNPTIKDMEALIDLELENLTSIRTLLPVILSINVPSIH